MQAACLGPVVPPALQKFDVLHPKCAPLCKVPRGGACSYWCIVSTYIYILYIYYIYIGIYIYDTSKSKLVSNNYVAVSQNVWAIFPGATCSGHSVPCSVKNICHPPFNTYPLALPCWDEVAIVFASVVCVVSHSTHSTH